jgi:hypothetical protein
MPGKVSILKYSILLRFLLFFHDKNLFGMLALKTAVVTNVLA